jgi:predicted alpha/beta-fold hydrolase
MSERVLDFAAPRFLRNRHVQTLAASLPLWADSDTPFEETRFALPGGGSLHARASWWRDGTSAAEPRRGPHQDEERTAVVLVHGIGGSSEASYVRRAAAALFRAGFHVVRLNLRGAGDSIPDAPLLYHAGLIEDPAVALEAVAKRPGVKDVALLGFSLGGNVSLKLAASWGGRVPAYVRAVASVSAPLDLVETSRALETLRTLPYRAYVLRKLLRQGREFARVHPSRAAYDVSRLRRVRTIRAYDEEVIAPMHGFCDAHDYYVNASAGPGLADVRVPTLVVHAADDPMIPEVSVRRWLRDASPAVRIAWSARGGHVGWFAGVREQAWINTWAIDRVAAFFRER